MTLVLRDASHPLMLHILNNVFSLNFVADVSQSSAIVAGLLRWDQPPRNDLACESGCCEMKSLAVTQIDLSSSFGCWSNNRHHDNNLVVSELA
jgi:hypothetical protein